MTERRTSSETLEEEPNMNTFRLKQATYQQCTVEAPARCHFCEIHQTESSLTSTAVRYLQVGAVKGENLLVITNDRRRKLISSWLTAAGLNVPELVSSGRLFIHSSSEVIEAVFVDGQPDWKRFEHAATAMFDKATWHAEKRVRFYGDAVSDLWSEGRHSAVIALEDHWARFEDEDRFDSASFCGYVIDALDPRTYSKYLLQLGAPHNFVMPSRDNHALNAALERSVREILDISLPDATDAGPDSRLPSVFRNAYWLSQHHSSDFSSVLRRARSVYAA